MDFRKSFRWESRKNKPLMLLKDYLLDDLSSCSSSGFKSFPRRPSLSSTTTSFSTSVRFLIDADLKSVIPPTKNGLSRTSSSTALFRSAAVMLINAVKSPLRRTWCFLPQKFIRNKAEDDVGKWSSYGGKESIKWGRDIVASIPTHPSDGNWEYIEITAETNGFRDAVEMGGEIVDGTNAGRSIGPCSKEWLKKKEQFSPLSVLDYPFDDDEETIDTQSESSPANVGARRGGHRPGGLSRLAPVKRISSLELEDEGTACLDECLVEEESKEEILERMINTVRTVDIPSFDSASDVFLRDFFGEKLTELEEYRNMGVFRGRDTFEDEAVRAAEDWARGEPRDVYLGWENEGGRTAYIKDMERDGGGDFERYEVCLEVDNVVWTLLVYEALIDIFE